MANQNSLQNSQNSSLNAKYFYFSDKFCESAEKDNFWAAQLCINNFKWKFVAKIWKGNHRGYLKNRQVCIGKVQQWVTINCVHKKMHPQSWGQDMVFLVDISFLIFQLLFS